VKSLAGIVVVDVLTRVFSHRLARGALAEQVFQDALHFRQRHAVLQPVELNREGAQLVDENALFGKTGGPAVGQFVLGAGRVEFPDCPVSALGVFERLDQADSVAGPCEAPPRANSSVIQRRAASAIRA
jgi:hypothetical protein